MPDKWAQYAVTPTQTNPAADPWAQYAVPAAPAAPATPAQATSQPEAPQQGFFSSLADTSGLSGLYQKGKEALQHPIQSAVDTFSGMNAVEPLYNEGARVYGELKQAATAPDSSQRLYHGIKAVPMVGPTLDKAADQYADKNYAGEAGTLTGTAAQMATMATDPLVNGLKRAGVPVPNTSIPNVASAVKSVPSAIRSAAIGDPNIAALKGLRVGPASNQVQKTISNVQTARPYLQGVKSLQQLQDKIPQAQSEIWAPYKDTINKVGSKTVQGPDGPTTIADLEAERAQLSALNRGIKSGQPAALQEALQKGRTAAQLLQRETAVKAALDPALSQYGIDPNLIRKTWGSVAQIGKQVSGKSSAMVEPQPTMFGRLLNANLSKPVEAIPQTLGFTRDVFALRNPLRANPVDMGIREGFRPTAPKPNLGQFSAPPPPSVYITPPPAVQGRGLSLPGRSPNPLQLPATAGGTAPQPMIGILNSHPGLYGPAATERVPPNIFTRPQAPTNGLFTGTPTGEILPPRRALPAPIKPLKKR